MAYCTVEDVAQFMTQRDFENSARTIAGVTLVGINPVIIYAVGHGFSTGDIVTFKNVGGTLELNANVYTITVIDADYISLDGTDSSTFSAFTNGGTVHLNAQTETGTWPDYDLIDSHINMAAGEIDIALMNSNQLTGTKSSAGLQLLKLLNVIGAVLITEYDNARFLTEGDLNRFQQWKDNYMKLIRDGELMLLDGETGKNYPAIATAEVGYTPEAQVDIYLNYLLRSL